MSTISGQSHQGQAPPNIQEIVELAGVWYWESDAGHRFRAIVAPGHDRYRPVASSLGRRRWELPGAEALGTSWEAHRATLEAHRPFRDFCYVVRAAGQPPRFVSATGEPLFAADGAFSGYRGTSRDVTASENALEEHRRLAQHLSNTIDSLPFGFGTIDREWRIRSANPMAERILGLTRDKLVGAPLWETFPGLADSPFGETQRRAMAQRSVEEFEGLYEPLGIWIRARSFPSGDGIAIAFSDVSGAWLAQQEVSRLNAELEQRVTQRTAQLEAATRDLEAFAYTVAHDLRAPLAAIAGYSKALEHSPEQRLGERSSHYLERIQAATRRLDQMSEAILSLSKLTRVQPRWRDVDLAELARHTLAMLRESQPQRHVECRVPASLRAKGDPALLQTVVDNLLANAWKYTAPRVHPVIEVGATSTADGQPAWFVRDNGVGFDPAQTQRLFEPFSRIHGAEFESTGIGLATVARIVARHGGRVWVEAAPGVGATFHFTLGAQAPERR